MYFGLHVYNLALTYMHTRHGCVFLVRTEKYVYFATMIDVYICCQVAEEECGSAAVADMETEPYFVDFLREAPEPTGIFPSLLHISLALMRSLHSHI